MRKFKNFIYKTNDIIIAFVVILLACGLIAWRLNVIMDYPATLVDTSVEQSEDANAAGSEADKADAKNDGAGDADKKGTGSDADKSSKASDDNSGSNSIYASGKLAKDISVTVNGGTATAAAQCLVDAGLFDSYTDYANACNKAGNSPEAIKASTFTFSKGMSKVSIAKMVTQ